MFSGTFGVVEVVKNASLTTLSPIVGDYDENQSGNDTFVNNCTLQGNSTQVERKPTNLGEIPAKEIIIVFLMLGLWVYSILLTRKAWYRILKE